MIKWNWEFFYKTLLSTNMPNYCCPLKPSFCASISLFDGPLGLVFARMMSARVSRWSNNSEATANIHSQRCWNSKSSTSLPEIIIKLQLNGSTVRIFKSSPMTTGVLCANFEVQSNQWRNYKFCNFVEWNELCNVSSRRKKFSWFLFSFSPNPRSSCSSPQWSKQRHHTSQKRLNPFVRKPLRRWLSKIKNGAFQFKRNKIESRWNGGKNSFQYG